MGKKKAAPNPTEPKKGKAPKPAKRNGNGKGGLPRPMLRVLKVLSGAKDPMTKAAVTEKAGINSGLVSDAIGRFDEAARKARDEKIGRPSLLTRELVKVVVAVGEDDSASYRLAITPAGAKALTEALDSLGGKLPPPRPGPTPTNGDK